MKKVITHIHILYESSILYVQNIFIIAKRK